MPDDNAALRHGAEICQSARSAPSTAPRDGIPTTDRPQGVRLGLTFKIWIGVCLTLVLGFVPLGLYQFQAVRANAIDNITLEAKTLALMLKTSGELFHQTLLKSQQPITEEQLDLLPIHAVARTATSWRPSLTDNHLQLRLASTDPSSNLFKPRTTDLALMEYFRQHPEAPDYSTETLDENGNTVFIYGQPIWTERYCLDCHGGENAVLAWVRDYRGVPRGYREGDLRALLTLQIAGHALDNQVRELFIGSLGIHIAIFVALTVVLSLLMQHLVIARLADLKAQSRRLTQGYPEARIRIHGDDELGDLADAFNEMAEQVQTRERELSQNEERLALFIEQAPAALAMFDHRLRYLAVSRRWIDEYQLAGQEVIGRAQADIASNFPAQLEALFREGFAGKVVTGEGEIPSRDGVARKWLRWEVLPWHRSDGRIGGLIIFTEDLSLHKEVQTTLDNSNRYHRGLLEASLDALLVVDREGRILDVNTATERLAGQARMQLIGHELAGYFAEADDARAGCRHAFDQGSIHDLRLSLLHSDGWSTPVLLNASLCSTEDGTAETLFVAARDVTAVHQMSDLLEARLRLLERTDNRSLDTLILECLDAATALGKSPISFFHARVQDDEISRFQTWSNPAADALCQSTDLSLHSLLLKAGVWLQCVKTHAPIINQENPRGLERPGLVDEVPGVSRELIVPVLRNNRVVGFLGVCNKPRDYDDGDLRVVTTLADLAWNLIERKRSAARLQSSEARYRRIVETAWEGIWIIDDSYRTTFVNARMAAMLGTETDEMLGKRLEDFLFDPDLGPSHDALSLHCAEDSRQYEELLRRADGSALWVLVSVVPILDDQGLFTGALRMVTDIGPLKAQQERLERLAHFDTLTGLPNRILLADRLRIALALARRDDHLLAICYLDLDNFKPVNDAYGHAAGDRLLIAVAERSVQVLREGDTVARVGGDEFLLLLGGLASAADARHMLARLQEVLSAPFDIGAAAPVQIFASIGFTLYPLDAGDPEALMRHADRAMYAAKQAGRNCTRQFDPQAIDQSVPSTLS